MEKVYKSKDSLSWDSYKTVIDESEEHNCPSMSFSGINEPLIQDDLEKYLKYANDHGFIDIILNTNASLLTKERVLSLLDSGITRIRFSIDATNSDTYLKIRQGADFQKVIGNIEEFINLKEERNYNLPVIGVNFCRMSLNEHEEEDFINYWEDKVDVVSIQTFYPPVFDVDYSHLFPLGNKVIDDKQKVCIQPFQRVFIRNYDITPCCRMFSSELKIGDLRKDNIYKSWPSKEMKVLRNMHISGTLKETICKQCLEIIKD